ncbi:MAG: hypothetical protein HY000_19175, partial [Planctomycetes bacterium]|nr:hypothetical protein [Planctomycetota bacterium]
SAGVKRVDAVGICLGEGHEDIANARVVFDDGCVAHLNASRVSFAPVRRMQIWSDDGYVGIDFAVRRAVVVRPRGAALQSAAAHTADMVVDHPHALGAPVYRRLAITNQTVDWPRSLEAEQIVPPAGDALAEELAEFVRCVRTGEQPHVDGRQGLAAVALAERVLKSLRRHRWDGDPAERVGPHLAPPSTIPTPHWHLASGHGRPAPVRGGAPEQQA